MSRPSEFNYEVTEEIAVLRTEPSGWTFELNMVSWNGGKPKFDLRKWSPDHDKMGRGVTFDKDDALAIVEALKEKI
jgi:hypothetical protein